MGSSERPLPLVEKMMEKDPRQTVATLEYLPDFQIVEILKVLPIRLSVIALKYLLVSHASELLEKLEQ